MGPRFIEVKFRQRPIPPLPGKPQIGEVIADVLHGVGLVGNFAFQLFDFGPQRGDFVCRINRLDGRSRRLGLRNQVKPQHSDACAERETQQGERQELTRSF